jgi:hypothetical protein
MYRHKFSGNLLTVDQLQQIAQRNHVAEIRIDVEDRQLGFLFERHHDRDDAQRIEIEILTQPGLRGHRAPVRRLYIAPDDVKKPALQQRQPAAPISMRSLIPPEMP